MQTRCQAAALVVALCVAACGGGGGGASISTPAQPSAPPPPPPAPPTPTALEITRLELAQTHVVPDAGLQWTLPNASESLHAIGGREALAVMTLSSDDARNVQLEGWAGVALGAVPVTSSLPPTEAGGPAYPGGRYSAILPREWMVPGLRLRARADNYSVGLYRDPLIGADSPMTLRVLPFYLFGANATNSIPPAEIATIDTGTAEELFAKWPVATLVAQNHPARQAIWPTLVVRPRGVGQPAAVLRNTDQERQPFEIMGAVLDVLGGLLKANGEAPGPYQYYAPMIMFNAAGEFTGPGGGLGSVGGDAAVGDHDYAGIFVHEQGHAFGLPHQGEAYGQGRYPYPGGSLSGSAWGYDSIRHEFLAPFVPATAARYARCATDTFAGTPRQIDNAGRCIKQDPMQSGAGDEARGYRFATFSDYSTAVMQRHLEGVRSTDANGNPAFDGGSIIADPAFVGGYKRWDRITGRWVQVTPYVADRGLYGMNLGLPYRVGVPVHSIVITYSRAGTAGASQIYPPLSYTGNLLLDIDPTHSGQRSIIVPNGQGPAPWYCHNGGCDYTVRVTYDDGSMHHVVLQRGFRPWFEPTGTPAASTADPDSPDSFRMWVVNVPGERGLRKVELIDSPRAWEGLPVNTLVLASLTMTGGPQAAGFKPTRLDAATDACDGLATVVVPSSQAKTVCGRKKAAPLLEPKARPRRSTPER